jgi:hypothetical protein
MMLVPSVGGHEGCELGLDVGRENPGMEGLQGDTLHGGPVENPDAVLFPVSIPTPSFPSFAVMASRCSG